MSSRSIKKCKRGKCSSTLKNRHSSSSLALISPSDIKKLKTSILKNDADIERIIAKQPPAHMSQLLDSSNIGKAIKDLSNIEQIFNSNSSSIHSLSSSIGSDDSSSQEFFKINIIDKDKEITQHDIKNIKKYLKKLRKGIVCIIKSAKKEKLTDEKKLVKELDKIISLNEEDVPNKEEVAKPDETRNLFLYIVYRVSVLLAYGFKNLLIGVIRVITKPAHMIGVLMGVREIWVGGNSNIFPMLLTIAAAYAFSGFTIGPMVILASASFAVYYFMGILRIFKLLAYDLFFKWNYFI